MTSAKCCALILIATFAAVAFRLPRLAQRPMHGDEAVGAYKFGELLEEHRYVYDRKEYHGPTLDYFTLVPAGLTGAHSFVDLNEYHLRVVPLFFGTVLILGLLLIRDGLGPGPVILAAVLTAVSPVMVFYSRYYIHEMLLTCFSFGAIICGYRYLRKPGWSWAVGTGAFLGLMHATKETCVLAFVGMGAALAWLWVTAKRQNRRVPAQWSPIRSGHLFLAGGTAILVSVLFFSSFFSHPLGILDSVLTYQTYLKRGSGDSVHNHPWHYYLGLLAGYQYADGPVFSEALILVLASVGLAVSFSGKGLPQVDQGLLRFLGVYALFMTGVYSIIPYKTPWCLLEFYHGLILLAGVGAFWLLHPKTMKVRYAVAGLLILGIGHLALQAFWGNFRWYADSRNPYVYAHTSIDIFKITKRVKEMAAAHPEGKNMRIQVVCPNADYWPLPWYLRGYRVEYSNQVPETIPPAPLILYSPDVEPDIMWVLCELPEPGKKELYMHLFHEDDHLQYLELRPQVEIRGLVAKALYDRYLDARLEQARAPVNDPPRPEAMLSSTVQ